MVTAMDLMIGKIVCTPAAARVGDCVCVQVLSTQGKPFGDDELDITINGVPGPTQWMQWDQIGTKHLLAMFVKHGSPVQTATTQIEITAAEAGKEVPFVMIRSVFHRPTTAVFDVIHHRAPGAPAATPQPAPAGPPTGAPHAAPIGATAARAITVQPRASIAKAAAAKPSVRVVSNAASTLKFPAVAAHPLTIAPAKPVYAWEFGNKLSHSTADTRTEHDFAATLDPNKPRGLFHVKLTVSLPNRQPIEIRRSVSVVNHYYLAKQRGVVQPPVVDSDDNLRFRGDHYTATCTLQNVEPVELAFTSRRIELIFHDTRPHMMLKPESIKIALKPRDRTPITAVLTKAQVPPDAIGVAVHYAGVDAEHRAVRASTYFDLPAHYAKLVPPVPAAASKVLDDMVHKQLAARPTSIRAHEIKSAITSGAISALHRPPPPPPPGPPPPPSAPKVGDPCDPWSLPDHIPDGFACQATDVEEWVAMPSRFMNARKGDIILNAGNGSIIAGMMQNVVPPQVFSHSGIMTANREQITHSTASEDRLLAYPNGSIFGTPAPSDGFMPEALRYLWPGVITQEIDDAVNGQEMVDPQSPDHQKYTVAGFDTLEGMAPIKTGGTPVLIHSLVVKPDPTLETTEIRDKLHRIADHALAQTGKSHYSFFCYTDPTVGIKSRAPDSAPAWARGTFPSVCSSFIWLSVREIAGTIEGALESSDVKGGAEIGAKSPDGLYLYRADERLAAGEWLYNELVNIVNTSIADHGLLGSIGAGVADMQSDVANQVVNAFASDWCDTPAKDSEAWKQTKDAFAVSPDNILFWDTPLYGFSEPLIYRPQRYEKVTVSRWKKVATKGTLAGKVMFDGQPIDHASLQLYDGKVAGSDMHGGFTFHDVPAGDYVLSAQKVRPNGDNLTASVRVTVKANQTTNVNVTLKQPSDMYRQIKITGKMSTLDDGFWSDTRLTNPNLLAVLRVGPYGTHAEHVFSLIADDDTLGEIAIAVDWQVDKSVKVAMTARIYDGNQKTDSSYSGTIHFSVPAGTHGDWHVFAHDGNEVDGWFRFANDVEQS